MGTLTSWTNPINLLNSISPCDIVEFNRITYSHFAFYIGNGICVHVNPNDGSKDSSTSTDSSSKSKRLKSGTKRAERLVDIAGRDCVRLNNVEVTAFQLGVNRRSKNDAIQLAIRGLPVDDDGQIVIGKSIECRYHLMSAENCEGWCTYWRYDVPDGWSMQVANGTLNSTVGTVERASDAMICAAESVLSDNNAGISKKVIAAVGVVPYVATKYSVVGVKTVADAAVGGLMRLFR